jgi:hypothetical protein
VSPFRKVQKLIAAAGALAPCLLASVAQAASCGKGAAGFEQWKVEFAEAVKAAAVKRKGLAALAGAKYAAGTIQVDRSAKKAFSGSVDDFMRRLAEISPGHLQSGSARLEREIKANSRVRVVARVVIARVVVARVIGLIVGPIIGSIIVGPIVVGSIVAAIVGPIVAAIVGPMVPPPVSVPVVAMMVVIDVFDAVRLRLLGFRHEHRRGVQRHGKTRRQDCRHRDWQELFHRNLLQ